MAAIIFELRTGMFYLDFQKGIVPHNIHVCVAFFKTVEIPQCRAPDPSLVQFHISSSETILPKLREFFMFLAEVPILIIFPPMATLEIPIDLGKVTQQVKNKWHNYNKENTGNEKILLTERVNKCTIKTVILLLFLFNLISLTKSRTTDFIPNTYSAFPCVSATNNFPAH